MGKLYINQDGQLKEVSDKEYSAFHQSQVDAADKLAARLSKERKAKRAKALDKLKKLGLTDEEVNSL